ncbi:MAG TPA: tetratricopeptide repeat protein, partial [Phycisphaerae bacterium]|nr:tetratricopeptide repeat protein [Phycisphaerae bacterium]
MSVKGKGQAFFKRGDEVADTGNWDFAIEMYVEGIQREPANIENGYNKLREVALKRKAQGGKPPGILEQIKRRSGKDLEKNLANACYLWAKDPGSMLSMEQVIIAAQKLELNEVIVWMAKLMFEAAKTTQKPQKRSFIFLTDIFEQTNELKLAVEACRDAVNLSPQNSDPQLENRLNTLLANYTIQQGQYGQEGEGLRGVRDMEKQKELMQQDSLVKSEDYLEQQIRKTKREYEESPDVPGKISGYVDALLKIETPENQQTAIDVLQQAYKATNTYNYKMRIGDIKMRQHVIAVRQAKEAGNQEAYKKAYIDQLKFEITEFDERARNYPTDLGYKFELGRRLFTIGKYDEAIAALQGAQNDPRRKLLVANYLGQSFMKKQWWQEAVDTFEKALSADIPEERTKDIRYYLANCYENLGDLKNAQESYSAIAQIDFN